MSISSRPGSVPRHFSVLREMLPRRVGYCGLRPQRDRQHFGDDGATTRPLRKTLARRV